MTWIGNADAGAIAARLRAAKSVVVLTHAKPDGDAAGSALALARALHRAGLQAETWFVGPHPAWLPEVVDQTPHRLLAPAKPAEPIDGRGPLSINPDLFAVVDTGSWQQLAELKPIIESRAGQTVLVDHHAHGNPEVADLRLIDTKAASCTEVLAPVCCALAGTKSAAELPVDVATPLYLGLATDTGWFRYASVTGRTLRLAADLRDAGVVHTDLYRIIEQQDTIGRWRLIGRALSSVELHDLGRPWGRLAVMSLRLDDFSAAGADRNDTGGIADMVLAVRAVGAAALLTEGEVTRGEPPLTKISIRTKPIPGALDAGTLTARLGGGGHFHAAGAKMRTSLDEARTALLEQARAL